MNMKDKITCKCCGVSETKEYWWNLVDHNEWNNKEDYFLFLQSS